MLKQLTTALLLLLLPGAAWAQSDFLQKPATIVVPFASGSTGEIVARLLAEALEPRLGQRVLVETRSGAGGNIGAASVARAAPDGHTLVLGATSNFAINQFLYKNIGFDPLADLVPVAMVADVPSIMYVSAKVPAKDVKEFIAYAKANSGKLNYASPGAGSTPHLTAEILNQQAGLGMQHVAYRGAGPAITGMLSGEVELYFAGVGVGLPHLASGRMRALAAATAQRNKALPDLPTTAEAGYPGVVGSNWWALAAPKNTPAPMIRRWSEEVGKALTNPALLARFDELGLVPMGDGPEPFAARLKSEAAVWKAVVEKAGIRVD